MKTNKFVKAGMLCGAVALVMVACTDDIKPVLGTYSYKISGKAVVDDTISTMLTDEMGALEILRKGDDKMLLTLNTMNGDACYTEADIDGDNVTLDPFRHFINVTYRATVPDTIELTQPDTTIIDLPLRKDTIVTPGRDTVIYVERVFSKSFDVTVSGTGEVYDETILFNLNYSGNGVEDEDSQIEAEEVTMIAKRN